MQKRKPKTTEYNSHGVTIDGVSFKFRKWSIQNKHTRNNLQLPKTDKRSIVESDTESEREESGL